MKVYVARDVPQDNPVYQHLKAAGDISLTRSDTTDHQLTVLWNRSARLKPCPCSPGVCGCGYEVLQYGENCPFACTYCILDVYFPDPANIIYANVDSMADEIAHYLETRPFLRLGTGEFADSLVYEPYTGFTSALLDAVNRRVGTERLSIECKTKSLHVAPLRENPNRECILLSWSLNTPFISDTEERGAPDVFSRIDAAAEAANAGFPLAFHFDPLILYPGWQEGYAQTVNRLFSRVPSQSVVFISLGSLRFVPGQKRHILWRWPDSRLLRQEFIRGLDGKWRYPADMRVKQFAYLRELIRARTSSTIIYLCMEDERTWRRAMGWVPASSHDLNRVLWDAIRHHRKEYAG